MVLSRTVELRRRECITTHFLSPRQMWREESVLKCYAPAAHGHSLDVASTDRNMNTRAERSLRHCLFIVLPAMPLTCLTQISSPCSFSNVGYSFWAFFFGNF
jgi:hypothetical protein